jgi:hypothetical protein
MALETLRLDIKLYEDNNCNRRKPSLQKDASMLFPVNNGNEIFYCSLAYWRRPSDKSNNYKPGMKTLINARDAATLKLGNKKKGKGKAKERERKGKANVWRS